MDFSMAHNNLGNALLARGQRDDAITELREAIRLDKQNATAHYSLGVALGNNGQPDEAIAEYHEAIRLKKDYAAAHQGLGVELGAKGRVDEAIAELREAIRLKKDDAMAHFNLGVTLVNRGDVRAALEELRHGHELGSTDPRWRFPSAQYVRRCERLVELDRQLPGFLEGKATPASPGERIELAQLCTLKRLHRAAVRFYEEAFAAEPRLADDLGTGHRYHAASAAVLAGCGQGQDADQLDDKACARLRGQALDWLRANLTAWGQLLGKEPDKIRPAVQQTLRHWQQDPSFAGVRGDALARLPEAERKQWQQLWADVEQTLRKAADPDARDTRKNPSE
jgi:serine/threonine-protein kinase